MVGHASPSPPSPEIPMFKLRMASLLTLSLTVSLLAGCGEVTVFGHKVHDKQADAAVPPQSTPVPAATVPAPAGATPSAFPANTSVLKRVTVTIGAKGAAQVAAEPKFNAD